MMTSGPEETFREVASQFPITLYQVDGETGNVRVVSGCESDVSGPMMSRIHPEDRGRVQQVREDLIAGLCPIGEIDLRLSKEGDQWCWFHLRESRVADGLISGALFEIDDPNIKSEVLRDAELLLANSKSVLVRWGPGADLPVLYVSRNIEQFGYRAHEFLSQRIRYSDLIHPQDMPSIERDSAPFSTREYRIKCRDGSYRWVEEQAVVHRDDQGQLIHCSGLLNDITDRKLQEEALRNSNAKLTTAAAEAQKAAEVLHKHTEELSRARDAAVAYVRAREQLISNVSHELRTPLGGVLGTANLLLDGPLSEEQLAYTHMIRQSAESLLRVVDQILDFTQLRAREVEYEIRPADLLEVVSELYEEFLPIAREKRLELRLKTGDIPVTVLTDEMRLRQSLKHLVENAIKFTDSGWVEIALRTESLSPGRIIASFGISDSGIGIDESIASQIFESFTQGEGGANRRFGGIGLGLTICQHIAAMLGGSIGMESEPGIGSRFWLEIPFSLATSAPRESSSRATLPTINNRMVALDATRLAEVCGDDPEFLRAVLGEFVADGNKNLRALRDALELTDQEKALAILHRLKGSSRTVGAIEVAENTATIESAIQANGLSALELEIDRLEQAWERLEEAALSVMTQEAA